MLNRFTATSSTAEITSSIRVDGYAIVENALDMIEVRALSSQIKPHLEVTDPDCADAFMGERTKRFGRLLHRVPMTRKMVLDPVVLSTANALLLPYGPTCQVHFTGVMHIMEGETKQNLHRDLSPFPNPAPTLVLATMWAVTDFTRHTGATVFVPGSHKWPDSRIPLKNELAVAEMAAGSVFLYAGNLIHGAGSCKSGSRTGVALQYCVGWLRQEENQYLAVPLELARTFPKKLQRLMGYDLAARHWGYVDQIHPLNFLNCDFTYGGLDPEDLSFEGRVKCLHVREGDYHVKISYKATLDD